MRKLLFWCSISILLTVVLASFALAEMMVAGTYEGYFAKDRWGRNIFYYGNPCVFFVADDVAAKLTPYSGRPMQIDITEFDQWMNPGGVMITAVDKLTQLPVSYRLEARPASKTVTEGSGAKVHLSLQYLGDTPVKLYKGSIKVVLMTDSPRQPANFRDPEDRAYWYYAESYGWIKDGSLMQWGCRAFPVDLSVMSEQTVKALGGTAPKSAADVLTVSRGQKFKGDMTVGTELPPGKYSLFAWVQTSETAFASSGLIDFEVRPK